MKNILQRIAIVTFMALAIGVFSVNTFGQQMSREQAISEVTNYINYYNNIVAQWQNYLEQKVRPYYRDRTYGQWARNEYQKGQKEIELAMQWSQYYQNQLMALKSAGPQVPSDCRYRVAGSINEHAYGCGNSDGYKPGTIYYSEEIWRDSYGRTVSRENIFIQYDDGSVDRREYDRRYNGMKAAGYTFVRSGGKRQERF